MSAAFYDPEIAASIPEIVSYSVGAAGLAIGGLFFRQARRMRSTERQLRESEQARLLDSKTGLLHYPAFRDEFMERTGRIKRLAERGRVHGLLLGDIDDFKALNTRLGYTKTDESALLPVADIFRRTVRAESDVAAKFGGDEFVTLLTDTDLAGALTVAENLQGQVNMLRPDGSPLGLTIACTTFKQGTPLDNVMQPLEAAVLNQAKDVSGKNQIVAVQPLAA